MDVWMFDRVWDLLSGDCKAKLEGHASAVVSVAIHLDGNTLVSTSRDKTVK